jgi:hypothetical protein
LKKRAAGDRSTWIEELAIARAEEGKSSVASELKNILLRETQRRDARIIKSANGDQQRMGLSMVKTRKGEAWVEITEKRPMENALFRELRQRFNQAKSTPFCTSPMLEEIGPLGISRQARDILEGTYDIPNNCDPWAAKLIPHLKYAIPPIEFPMAHSEGHHCEGWQKVRERTSAGISGLTIPQMKAHIRDDYNVQVDTLFARIPYHYGFTPERWRNGIDVMLEKKKGVYNIDKLRAILLYEADFNQNNKKLGRQMLAMAEQYDAIAPEQFGSRKFLSAVDQSLNKALTFDLWRQNRTCAALCSNDAKGCYDRIVHNVASICMQRVRVPKEPIISMFGTIQELRHHVRTAFGDSEKSFSANSGSIPIQGVGQGNGAGPQIWALVSTPIFNMLRSMGLGLKMCSSLSRNELLLVGFGFVDDTDLAISNDECTSARDAARQLQAAVTAWEGGLRATGGALEPTKSLWYPIEFGWKAGEPYYKSVKECKVDPILVRDPSGKVQPLQCLEPSQAERTLGVRLAPDGNMETQFEYMLETARSWSTRLKAGHLPRHLTWKAWMSTITKTLEYPLPVTTLSRAQCQKLSSELIGAALPQVGVVSTFPRALAHAPRKFFGLNIPDFYIKQGVAHVEKLVKLSKSMKHPTACLLRHSAEAMRTTLGCNGKLFQIPWQVSVLLEDSWLKSTWEFVHTYGISIEDDIPELQAWREYDVLLIPTFLKMGYAGQELRLVNMCRLFYHVSWLSEICSGDGLRIIRCYMDDSGIPTDSEVRYPQQIRPPQLAWKVWKRALSRLCDANQTLHRPLGDWVRRSKWSYDPISERLFSKQGESAVEYQALRTRRSRNSWATFAYPVETTAIPASALPATVLPGRHPVLTGFSRIRVPTQGKPSSLSQFLSTIHQDAQWVVENVEVCGDWQTWALSNQHMLYGVSDGSFKEKFGTAAYVIGVVDKPQIYMRGRVVTPGNPEEQNAFRSELAGIYAITVMHWAVCEYFTLEQGQIELACDGKSALHQAQWSEDFINTQYPHYDMILAIRSIRQRTNWNWSWRHVKGHQDDTGAVLDFWAQANVQMDSMAKQHWAETRNSVVPSLKIWGEPWQVWVGPKKITSSLSRTLQNFCSEQSAKKYWRAKPRIGEKIDSVDWEAIGGAMKAVPLNRQVWIAKHVTGFCATGNNMLRRKVRTTAQCPRCTHDETPEHVWKCRGAEANDIWDKSIQALKSWLQENSTHPEVSMAIIEYLDSWRYDRPPNLRTVQGWIEPAIAHQSELGWRNLLEGIPSQQWQEIQRVYFSRIGSARSPKRWTIALIQKMWDIAWNMWEHRNGILHDKEQSIILQHLNTNIREEFKKGMSGLPKEAKALFSQGCAAVLAKPAEVKQQWLARIQLARRRALKMQTLGQTFGDERRVMARWLQGSTTS